MYVNLLWKEYRSIRSPLILLAISLVAVAILAPIVKSSALTILEWLFFAVAISFYLLLGSDTFAGEYQTGTMDFLLSRAISRRDLWHAKFSLRSGVLVLSLAFLWLLSCYAPSAFEEAIAYRFIFVASAVFVFAVGFLFSTVVDKPIVAATATFCSYLLISMLCWPYSVYIEIFLWFCAISALLAIVASFLLFTRGNAIASANR